MWRFKFAVVALSLVCAGCGEGSAPTSEPVPGELILPPDATPANFTEDNSHNQDTDYAAPGLRVLGSDFAVVDMAVRTQSAFQIKSGGAILELVASTQGNVLVEENFVLIADGGFSHPTINALEQSGHTVSVFRLADVDQQRMLAVRTQLADMRAETPGQNELQLGAAIDGCLMTGSEPPDSLDMLVALRIAPDGDFLSILEETAERATDTPLSSLFWTPCEENLSN